MEMAAVTYARWSRRDVRRVFAGLDAPDPGELVGRWDGEFVGRPGLRRVAGVVVASSPLRGWCGKEITASGEVRNLVRRPGGTVSVPGATLTTGPSSLDGRPADIVDYSEMSSRTMKRARGELRWLTPGAELLGVLFPFGTPRVGPFPYVMRRSSGA